MRQEILRLLDDAAGSAPPEPLGDARLEELAGDWRGKYRTMRPEAACRLLDALARVERPEPARFAVFVLAGLERRFGDALWPEVERWAEELQDPGLLRLVARRVAAPLLAARPALVERLEGAPEPPSPRVALLLAEAARALHVTDPEAAGRVAGLAARE